MPGAQCSPPFGVHDFISSHKELLVWLGVFSVITFIGSLLLIPFLCVRMGEDYFMPHRDAERTLEGRHPVIRWTGLILKNIIGVLLVLAGIAMLFLPGQGLLTVIIGIMMLNFPGKRALELRLIRLPGVLRAVNALRARAKHPPLQLPPRAE
ncbi:MAG: PGPGW domain-containing protein [Verrucomicrobiaceae bacterium]